MFCLWTVFANSVAALTAAMHYNKQKSVSGLEQFSAAGKGIHSLCYTKAPHNDVLPCRCITCSTMAGQKMGNTAMWEAVLPCTWIGKVKMQTSYCFCSHSSICSSMLCSLLFSLGIQFCRHKATVRIPSSPNMWFMLAAWIVLHTSRNPICQVWRDLSGSRPTVTIYSSWSLVCKC